MLHIYYSFKILSRKTYTVFFHRKSTTSHNSPKYLIQDEIKKREKRMNKIVRKKKYERNLWLLQ